MYPPPAPPNVSNSTSNQNHHHHPTRPTRAGIVVSPPSSRPSSRASVNTFRVYDDASISSTSPIHTALLGATLAFRQHANPSKTIAKPGDGPLLDRSLPSRAPQQASFEQEKTSQQSRTTMAGNLKIAQQERAPHSTSPSHQAAFLASQRAKQSTAVPKNGLSNGRPANIHAGPSGIRPVVAPKPRRLSSHQGKGSFDRISLHDQPTDTTSIAPTTSLVDLFEQRAYEQAIRPATRPEPIVIKPSKDLPLSSPRPVRSGLTSMFQLELEERQNSDRPEPDPAKPRNQDSVPGQYNGNSSEDAFASASEDQNVDSPPASLPRPESRRLSPSPEEVLRSQYDAQRIPKHSQSPSPMRYSVSKPMQIRQPPQRPSSTPFDSLSPSSARSMRSIPAQYNQLHPRRMTPLTTGDDLANAMVASSLASSRAPSPMRLEPPPVPTRKKKGHHRTLPFSRTPSPAKVGMLHTLRPQEDTSSSDSDDQKHPYRKHQKKRHIRKHPNKHHEGDRKRWRDAVTERERKRYEGVYASNKGLYTTSDQVSGIVARDIWSRSRLSEQTLEFVWDLVAPDGTGSLTRDQFVVGLWLIDQRLKGRKLPITVGDSVWASVKGVGGIKIKKMK